MLLSHSAIPGEGRAHCPCAQGGHEGARAHGGPHYHAEGARWPSRLDTRASPSRYRSQEWWRHEAL